MTLSDDLAGGDVESGEQRRGAVAFVVVRHGPSPTLLDRQAGLRAIERLDLAFLVGREHQGFVRRIERVVEMTLREKPPTATHWSARVTTKAVGISHTSVQRIWNAHGLKPYLVKKFKLSNDKRFVEKVKDVVGLYLTSGLACRQILAPPPAKSLPRTPDIGADLSQILDHLDTGELSGWERKFARSIPSRSTFSDKQEAVIRRIDSRLRRAARAAA